MSNAAADEIPPLSEEDRLYAEDFGSHVHYDRELFPQLLQMDPAIEGDLWSSGRDGEEPATLTPRGKAYYTHLLNTLGLAPELALVVRKLKDMRLLHRQLMSAELLLTAEQAKQELDKRRRDALRNRPLFTALADLDSQALAEELHRKQCEAAGLLAFPVTKEGRKRIRRE